MLKSLTLLLGFSFTITFNNYAVTKFISYLDTNDVNDFKNIPPEIQKEIEIQGLVYTHPDNDLEDENLCTLSNEKKISLCENIFNLNFYKFEINIHLNKIAFYKANVKCEKKLIISRFFPNQENIIRIMYPCFGRQRNIVRTSFIEDDFYNFFYVSAGTRKNSIIVYMYDSRSTSKSFYLFDFIHHVDLTDLKNISITEKDVLSELKLNKKLITTLESSRIADLFINEQDYLKDDPVCDLEYEKKITLCNIIFNHSFYQETNVILNSFASYLFNMGCIARSVYYQDDTLEESFLLRDEQKLFSCYARRSNSDENVFVDNFFKSFYISRGPKRNSIIVYIRLMLDEHEIISIFFMTENINFRALKPTTITDADLRAESYQAYLEVEEIMESARKEYDDELTHLYVTSKSEKNEYELLEQKVDINEQSITEMRQNVNVNDSVILYPKDKQKKKDVQLYYGYYGDYLKENVKQTYFKQEDTQKNKTTSVFHVLYNIDRKGKRSNQSQTSSVTEYAHLGPQAFKRMLDKIKLELSNQKIIKFDNATGKIKEIPFHKAEKRTVKDEKLIDEIKTLTTKMRLFVVKRNVKEALAMRNETNKEKDILQSDLVSATEEKLQQKENIAVEEKSKSEKTKTVSRENLKKKKKSSK